MAYLNSVSSLKQTLNDKRQKLYFILYKSRLLYISCRIFLGKMAYHMLVSCIVWKKISLEESYYFNKIKDTCNNTTFLNLFY